MTGPVSADDVQAIVDAAVAGLVTRLDRDWHVGATGLDWTCWETLEHLADSLYSYAARLVRVPDEIAGGYPYAYRALRDGGPEGIMFAHPEVGTRGVLRIVASVGGLLAAAVRNADPSLRANHVWGRSDREGFAAMGVVEKAVHVHNVAGPLDLDWRPDDGVCARALHRLFPDVPLDRGAGAFGTLLWATGRDDLPGRPRRGPDWRWYS